MAIQQNKAERVDKACNLILECFDMNNITKSEGVSAMASVLTSILAHYDDRSIFDNTIQTMQSIFEENRK